MLYNVGHVILTWVMLCYITWPSIDMGNVMLYNMAHVMLYNMCHVMLYNMGYVMLYNMGWVMLCYIT